MSLHNPESDKRALWPDVKNPLDWTVRQWFFLAAVLGAFFLAFPETDLLVSGLFFDVDKGGWHWKDFWLFVLTYKGLPPVTIIMVLAVLAFWGWGERIGKPVLGVTRRVMLYIVLVIALGPGLFANTLFKDNWGRARPAHVEAFGGDKTFTPPFIITDQCEKNCSFVSGHASMGFTMIMFGFLVADRATRRRIFVIAFTFGVIVGLGRIGQGRHFFSDTIYAFFTVYFTAWILSKILLSPGWLRWGWLDRGKLGNSADA